MPVFVFLLVGLIGIPLVELYVLIEVGRSIGAGTTVALVVLTAVVGAWLLRAQGLATIARMRAALEAGELPALEVVEGLILLVTGAMLLTPGFITDTLGFLCLVPAVRRLIAARIAERMVVRVARPPGGPRGPGGRHTIDGDYTVEDDEARRRIK
jgi:UPF0716 protein FxsA